jgi:nucleotide-binding universal stress UspA family protein
MISTGTHSDIVIGVDGTAPSWDALYWAAREAQRRRSRLRVVFVDTAQSSDTAEPPDPALASRKLAHMVTDARRLEPSVRVNGVIVEGDPSTALSLAASGAALLVVGDEGEPGHTALGRAGRAVADASAVPVVVVRGQLPPDHSPVVVGADGSAGTHSAVGLAFEEAGMRGCPLIAVSSAGATLDESLAPWRDKFPRVPVRTTTIEAEPTPALLALSRRAQLVVLGHGDDDLLGPVPSSILDSAHCPVLISA